MTGVRLLLLLVLLPLVTNGGSLRTVVEYCKFEMRAIPGFDPLVVTDDNGKSCRINLKVPFCHGKCHTSEVGTHTFPFRTQNNSICAILGDAVEERRIDDCDEGADESIRTIRVSAATSCGCYELKPDE
ncbi:hypothetical protein QR680_005451 [Steinernema hermaphroditum]|uniref:Glycoprotein hormone subunit beta domain-containing protein n=1 Tax=Steinernema hermaphroditum TaxID=289476 RepID=A0AA39LVE8_9BILA|nr:hypothetical protein QR680_005451 [Steinernema hermaphroditum]